MALLGIVSSIARDLVQLVPKWIEQRRQYLVISYIFQADFSGNHLVGTSIDRKV